MKYGYVRISTREQDEARQVEAIKSAGIDEDNIIIEKSSGKNFIDRKKWQELMAKVVVGNVIVIKSLDGLGRNNTEIKDTFELLSKKKVYLKFLDTPILNTEAPKNEMEKIAMEMIQPIILHLLGFFAEQERKNIKERQIFDRVKNIRAVIKYHNKSFLTAFFKIFYFVIFLSKLH